MKQSKFLAAAMVAVMSVGGIVLAEDAPNNTPKPPHAAVKPMPATRPIVLRLKPWSDLPDLTEEQKAKIDELHKAALKEEDAVKAKEKEDITAVLTDAQKTELAEIDAKQKEHEKELRDKMHHPATAPAPAPGAAPNEPKQ